MPTYDETLELIYGVEDAHEIECKRVLVEEGEFENVYTTRDDERVQYPCLTVQFVCGATTGKQHITPDGIRDSAWNGQFTIGIHTTRNGSASSDSDHRPSRAKVRKLMAKFETLFDMDYHALCKVSEAGCVPSFEGEEDVDSSLISFNTVSEVKKATWPTATP